MLGAMWGPGDALVNETGSGPVLTDLPRAGAAFEGAAS